MRVKPLSDRVLVQPDDEETKSEGGIIIPDNAQEKPHRGKVVRVGPGKRDESGKVCPTSVKEGDKVLYGKYSGTKVKIGQDELLFMREEDIMAVVED